MTKINQYRFYILLMFCFCHIHTTAQRSFRLIIKDADSLVIPANDIGLTTEFTSKEKCLLYVQQLPSLLMTKGYISASVDAVTEDSTSVQLVLFKGKKYTWNNLNISQEDWPLLNQLGYNSSSFSNKPFDQQKVALVYNQLLDYLSKNGYPFAKLYLDSIVLNDGLINANLQVDKGALYHIDTLIINGDVKISKYFLTRYLDIEEKEIYNEEKLNRLDARLSELPFIVQTQAHTVSMLNTGAEVNLYLQDRKSNQVNVLVGFLPSNAALGGKLLVTGEANLNLRNPFGNAETLGINWQQLQSKSPRLDLLFIRPYLFHSPVGMNINFELYKRDSLFLNIHSSIGAQYNVSSGKSVTVAIQFNRTNLLSVDTSLIKQTKRLPDMIDMSSTALSLQYDYNNTNYRFNPRKGNEFRFSVAFGQKNIQRNNTIVTIKDPLFNYNSLYDTVQQKSYQLRTILNAARYFPLGKQATLKVAMQSGWFQSPSYYVNEVFQIGGFRQLRGFDEESIYTNRFLIGTLEYRYLLAQNSWFFVFTDIGRAAYKTNSADFTHNYFGAGTGLAFETNSGIFNISYAVGKRNDQSFDLRQSKIHIGFLSLF